MALNDFRAIIVPDRSCPFMKRRNTVMNNNKFTTEKLAKLAMMTAVSIVLVLLVRIPWPAAPFLEYDPADLPIYITAFAFGPLEGLLVTLVVCLIQAFALGGSGVYGFIMHFAATGIVVVVIGMMYRRNKTKKTAIKALVTGVILTTVIMCVMNIIVTPAFMGAPRSAVIAMIPTVIIPFNLVKAGVNSLLTFILYKRISGLLHGSTKTVKQEE